MPASCVCCSERPQIEDKTKLIEDKVHCITDHPGFETVFLNVSVLHAAYF
uniref:Uncharacterized protein n=1 Tax=Amphimedon queenslandica TaxID=400682 RepID=A0A1X7UBX9_AMPQE